MESSARLGVARYTLRLSDTGSVCAAGLPDYVDSFSMGAFLIDVEEPPKSLNVADSQRTHGRLQGFFSSISAHMLS